MSKILTFLFSLFILSACNVENTERVESSLPETKDLIIKKEMGLTEYVKSISSEVNSLHVGKATNHLALSFWYKPVDYCVLQEAGLNSSKQNFNKLKTDYAGAAYFELSVQQLDSLQSSAAGKTDSVLKANTAEYFGYHIQPDLLMINGKDTFPCALSHYVDNSSLVSQKILCAFEKPESFNNVQLIWIDKLYNSGVHVFSFNGENMNAYDRINLKFNN